MRSVVDSCSQKSFSVHRFRFCSVLALLFAATNLFAQFSNGPRSLPNAGGSLFLQQGMGQPVIPFVNHVSPGIAPLQHPMIERNDFVTPNLAIPSIFQTIPTYASGGANASSTAIGDVNGDGIADLAVVNQCAYNCIGSVGILLGNGDGTFQTAVTYATTGANSNSIALADVNGDGHLDILVANQCADTSGNCTSSSISVLLGNGDGTFQTGVSYGASGGYAFSIAVADVNGDGKPDVLISEECANVNSCTGGLVSVFLGNGNGTFQPAVAYNSGGLYAFSVAVADVNGDGYPDMVVTNGCSSNSCTSGAVDILLGTGTGTFQSAVSYNAGGYFSRWVSIGDLNGDGKLDLVVANECNNNTDCTAGSVGVLLGNGNGTFQSAVSYPSGGSDAFSAALADINGDGKIDVIVGNLSDYGGGNGRVGVMLGNGDGTLQPALSYNTGGNRLDSVLVKDVNGDGKPDILGTNQCIDGSCASGSVGVLLGNGNGTFQGISPYNPGGTSTISLAAVDVNGDGKLDLLAANECETSCGNGNNGSVGVLLGNGDGTFQAPVQYASNGMYSLSVAAADVNGDGKLDVLIANQCSDNSCSSNGSVSVLLGNGNGTLQTATAYGSGGLYAIAIVVGDVNGDGKPDLVVANECNNSSSCSNGTVGVLLGNGDGTFQPAVGYNSGGRSTLSAAIADVNGDGKPDLLLSNACTDGTCTSGSVSVLLGNGDGTFQPAINYNSGGLQAGPLAVKDLNGDGKLDLIVTDACQSNSSCNYGFVAILLGNGDGTFQAATTINVPSAGGLSQLVLADLNGDGNLDIASSSGGFLLLGNGDGTFQPYIELGAGGEAMAIGDFNGDGKPDLAAGGITVLRNVSSGFRFATSTALSASSNSGSLILTATVTSSLSGVPSGTVSFMDGATVLGTSALNGSGVASFSTVALSAGAHNITAIYSGNGDIEASTSSVMAVSADFSLSASIPSPASVTPGQSSTSTITVSPTNGFNPSGLTFTCSIAPVVKPAPTCSVGEVSVANDTGSATLTIATAARESAYAVVPARRGSRAPFGLALLISGLVFGAVGIGKQDRGRLLTWVFAFTLLGGCVLQAGCGGGGSSTATTPSGNVRAGSYTVTITGSANGMHHSTTATVKVN